MKLIVTYDISNDRDREEFSGHLERLGLTRIQRSVFIGRGNLQLIKDIEKLAKKYIEPSRDCVLIVPIDEYYWRRSRVLGTPFNGNRKLVGVDIIA